MLTSPLCPLLLFLVLSASAPARGQHDSCPAPLEERACGVQKDELQYLLYSVRAGEGFNLCRDVYIRMVQVVTSLRTKGFNVTLVLPAWGPLPHWPLDKVNTGLRWSEFFDTDSMNLVIPVMEQAEFEANISPEADLELNLSHFADTFSRQSEWEERFQVEQCAERDEMRRLSAGRRIHCSCSGLSAKLVKCLFLDGTSETLAAVIEEHFREHKSIRICNADVVLHHNYGSAFFWQIRRSMRFSRKLIQAGNEFRSQFLDSNDQKDGTEMLSDWRQMQRIDGDATGGDYLCLHWRRGDFALVRKDVPCMQCVADQVSRLAQRQKIHRLFLATDASPLEIRQLSRLLHQSGIQVHIFDSERTGGWPQGQEAIIDQWICAHGRYFVGQEVVPLTICVFCTTWPNNL